MERDTGEGAEYGLEKPDVCCLALSLSVAMLEVIAVQGSAAARWWYMLYGLVGVVYGQGVGETPVPPVVPPKLVPILPVSMVPAVPMPAATDEAVVLKQLIEFWWWFVGTIDVPSGFTVHGKVLAPSGDGTLAQLLYE